MTEDRIGLIVRRLRHRLDWTQVELGRRAGCSGSVVSRVERGHLEACSLSTLRRMLAALGARLTLSVQWRGGELDRLLDADHARLQESWARRKARLRPGWRSRQEVTFSEYGERGSIDDLAFDPATGTLLVTEIKTGIYDAGGTLARLDVKERLAPIIARRLGWKVARVVPCLVLADTRTNRRRLIDHAGQLARFECRGRAAAAWLRDPSAAVAGLLVLEKLPAGGGVSGMRAGRQRVRPRRSGTAGAAQAQGGKRASHER
ncbi:MAG TPA: helix-turn-helix transcriptional regulator [Candidatus Limnocylindria bacterium]|nr:helix-turn-helix transcriptional regulator [Candidatus Limnocylindria bacterium]